MCIHLLDTHVLGTPGDWRMIPTTANGHPAAAIYNRDADGVLRANGVVVLATTAAARAGGASWASLAPALGVASRQAAERRFLRLRPSATGETTGEARVDAERDRRAGDRAVAEWARRNAAVLRQLAGQVSALDSLDATARESADQLGAALGDDDVTNLLPPLAAVRAHLTRDHTGLADRLGAISDHTDQLRREAAGNRRTRTT
jgi:hypothetical protein